MLKVFHGDTELEFPSLLTTTPIRLWDEDLVLVSFEELHETVCADAPIDDEITENH